MCLKKWSIKINNIHMNARSKRISLENRSSSLSGFRPEFIPNPVLRRPHFLFFFNETALCSFRRSFLPQPTTETAADFWDQLPVTSLADLIPTRKRSKLRNSAPHGGSRAEFPGSPCIGRATPSGFNTTLDLIRIQPYCCGSSTPCPHLGPHPM